MTTRDNEMIHLLIQDDYNCMNMDGGERLYHILTEGHIGYTNLSTIELEDELEVRGIPVPVV
jgi:hypothetical protein